MTTETLQIWNNFANSVIAVANIILFTVGFLSLRNDRRRITKMEQSDRRKFADNVYAWIEERSENSTKVFCHNGGISIIYDVRVSTLDVSGAVIGDSYEIELMKPREERNFIMKHASGAQVGGLCLAFRDPSGVSWLRSGDGTLSEFPNEHELAESPKSIDGQQIRQQQPFPLESKRRSLVKTIIWRVIGILWTFVGTYLIISFLPSKYSTVLAISTIIAAYHHSTRMFMYYFYERIWLHIKWGRTSEHIAPMSRSEKFLWTLGALTAVILILYFLIYINPQIDPNIASHK